MHRTNIILSISIIIVGLLLGSCRHNNNLKEQGYIEGRFTYISSQSGGTLDNLAVKRGDAVHAGQLLFKLDVNPQIASQQQAQAKLQQAQASLHNLLKGKRQQELDVIIAQRRQAQAKLIFAW